MYYMQNNIDLLIISPYCSHILQPFDIGIFAVFKRQHIIKMYIINQFNL